MNTKLVDKFKMNNQALADFQHTYHPLQYLGRLKDIEKLDTETLSLIVEDYQTHHRMVINFLKGKDKKEILNRLIEDRKRLEYRI